jgi:hypothetical protein
MRKFAEIFLKIEGIWHFIGSTIAVIMLVYQHDYNFSAWFAPMADYIMGAGTFMCGWWLGEEGHKHG